MTACREIPACPVPSPHCDCQPPEGYVTPVTLSLSDGGQSVPRSANRSPSGTPERSTFIDIGAILASGLPEPPRPSICRREDGLGLFYPGQTNTIFGDPESGKTWLALAAATETVHDGGTALIIDADHNGAEQTLSRLLGLGLTPHQLSDADTFRLAEPEDAEHLREIVREAVTWAPSVAIIDSIGEVLPILGLNSNSGDDYTTANRRVMAPLARAGSAVIAVDHLAKGAESRAAGPTGTHAKRRALGGTSLRVTMREPFAPGRGGCAALSIHKDRPGGLRGASPVSGRAEQPAGLFVMRQDADRLSWHITEPTEADALSDEELGTVRPRYRVTDRDVAEVDALPEGDRASVRKVASALGWGNDRATATLAQWRRLHGGEA